MIPTRIHAVLDYIIGAALILVPLLWIEQSPVGAWVPMILGAVIIIYSLITAYEYSVAKIIPVTGHLVLDAIAGIFLAASPWIFGFADVVWIPHVVIGAIDVVAALATRRVPDRAIARDGTVRHDRPAHA